MSYDVSEDLLVSALRLIVSTEIAALVNTGALPVVCETRGYPAPLESIEQMKLPCMCIYVTSDTNVRTGQRVDTRSEVAFEYILPATPLPKLDLRWPLLREVWKATWKSVKRGVSGAVNALDEVGVIHIEEDAASANYSFASGGEFAYPVFVGKMRITTRPGSSTPTQDFLSLLANINRVEPDANPSIQPQVQVLAVSET